MIHPKRQYCKHCQQPQKVCICYAIENINNRVAITILMHPSELKSTKGTAKLLPLCLQDCHIIIGESESDFTKIKTQIRNDTRKTYLIYPDDKAQSLETLKLDKNSSIRLILLDGTWRKVHKILQLNPWLQTLPKLSFNHAPQGNYEIRQAKRDDSLSTLEATAYALSQLDQCDVQPLYNAFEALKQSQIAFMPDHVKARLTSKNK